MTGQMTQGVPIDGNRTKLPLVPAIVPLAVTNNASLSSAQTITLNAATTFIEVNALAQAVFLRWAAVPTSSAFDEFIQAGATRHYVVPAGKATVQFLEQAASARIIVIEK